MSWGLLQQHLATVCDVQKLRIFILFSTTQHASKELKACLVKLNKALSNSAPSIARSHFSLYTRVLQLTLWYLQYYTGNREPNRVITNFSSYPTFRIWTRSRLFLFCFGFLFCFLLNTVKELLDLRVKHHHHGGLGPWSTGWHPCP